MNVPKLRFKEFRDEWKLLDLSKSFEYYSTNSLSREQLSNSGILKNVHYGDIHRKFSTIVNECIDIDTYIKDVNYNNKYELIKENDLVFADASEDYEGIGKAIEIVNIKNNAVSGLHTILARDKNNIFVPMFKGYYFNSPVVHNQLRILANGFKVFGISKDSINKLKVKIPTDSEQNKIANTLYLLDKKIELQSKKIEDLKLFKKGLRANVFNSYPTVEKIIKDLGEIVTGTTPSKNKDEYWKNGKIVWVTPSDITYHKDISNSAFKLTQEGLNKGRLIPKNSVLVTCIASIGKNAIIKVDGSCNQQINAIIPKGDNLSDYIYYLLDYESEYMVSIAATSATSIINKEQFSNLKVKVHNPRDQKKISTILNLIERKISLEEEIYDKLRQLKKGLMQNMFI